MSDRRRTIRVHDYLRPWQTIQRLERTSDKPLVYTALLDMDWPRGARVTIDGDEGWVEQRRWRWMR